MADQNVHSHTRTGVAVDHLLRRRWSAPHITPWGYRYYGARSRLSRVPTVHPTVPVPIASPQTWCESRRVWGDVKGCGTILDVDSEEFGGVEEHEEVGAEVDDGCLNGADESDKCCGDAEDVDDADADE